VVLIDKDTPDEVKDVLYNMERTVDELLAADMIPLKGYKAGTSKPQVLEKGKTLEPRVTCPRWFCHDSVPELDSMVPH